MIVTPDASVLLKWVLPGHDEQDTDSALALRDEAVTGTLDLVVPQLWIYEVGNALARRFPGDAEELLASLADFGLTEAKPDTVHGVPGRCMISNNSNGLWGFTFVFFSPSFRMGFPAVCSGRTAIRDQSSPRSIPSRWRHAHELRLYVGSSLQLLSPRRRKRRWTRRLARSVQSASASYAPALPVSVSHKGLRGEIPWEPGGSESPDGRSPAWVRGSGRSRVRPGRR